MRLSRKYIFAFAFFYCLTDMAIAEDLFIDPTSSLSLFRFHNGKIADNKPQIDNDTPRLPGIATTWVVLQWRQSHNLSASELQTAPPTMPSFGTAKPLYIFANSDNSASLTVFRSGDRYPVELREKDGVLVSGGGSNIFLSSDAKVASDFSAPIRYEVELGVDTATIDYDSSSAKASGAVLGTAFSGFRIQMIDKAHKSSISAFIQIQHITSRDTPADHRGCHVRADGGAPQIVYSRTLPGEQFLPFKSTNGIMHTFSYDLTKYYQDMISKPVKCSDQNGNVVTFDWPVEALKGENWHLTSMFIGLETENKDNRPSSQNRKTQGSVDLGLFIGRLKVYK